MPSPQQNDAEEAPALPATRLKTINQGVGVLERHFKRWLGFKLDVGLCATIAAHIASDLGCRAKDVSNLSQTLLQYSGQLLTLDFIQRLVRKLVVNSDSLRAGPILIHTGFHRAQWVPYEIVNLSSAVWKTGSPAKILQLYALAGSCAGEVFDKKVPESWLSYFAYQIGFTRRVQYPDEPILFIRLRFWAYMKPNAEDATKLDFAKFECDRQLKEWNSVIIRRRLRLDLNMDEYTKDGDLKKWACPRGYDHYCDRCPESVSFCAASYNARQSPEDFFEWGTPSPG